MRLIDADALKKDIMSYKTMPEIRKAICEVIDNAKTIIWCNQTSDGVPMMDLRGTQKGDLISRSALKEIWELYEKYQPSLATNVYEFGVALKGIIDNAPTVAVDNYAMGYQDGVRKVLSEMHKNEQKENNND